MKFGGLSEKEINEISALLRAENISYEIKTDQEMINSNDQSMKHNLRHLNAPSISTHVLALLVPEDSFNKMSQELKEKLLDFGITDQVPLELDFSEEEPVLVQEELLKGSKRLVGRSFLHQLLIGGGALLIYWAIKSL
jgi:hypothetical protein